MLNQVLAKRIRRRVQSGEWIHYLRGLLIRHKFTSAGYVAVVGGLPLPTIINRGGEIHVDNIGLFSGVRIECMQGGEVRIGKGTYLNRNTHIVAAKSVTIGELCQISWDVLIMDTDQHGLRPGESAVGKPVAIGNRVWIGARAIILKGVSIGDHSVVAAGAIVTRDVPPYTLVAGPRASVIRSLH